MKRCIVLVVAVSFGLCRLLSAEPATASSTSLAKALTAEEFARAGLNKLTPEELAFLEATLASKSLSPAAPMAVSGGSALGGGVGAVSSAPAAALPRTNSSAKRTAAQPSAVTPPPSGPSDAPATAQSDFGAEQISKVRSTSGSDELHTAIEGTVQEFSGRAVFVLANGQVWQQRTPQDVFLSKKLVNPAVTLIRTSLGYKMLIDAANVIVFVKRIQ